MVDVMWNDKVGYKMMWWDAIRWDMWFKCDTMWYDMLYNNTCSFCIFIGRELCVIKVHTHEWRQLMASSNLTNLFRGSSHDFCQLYYNIKQIDFIFLCFCTVIDHRWRHSVWRTKSHALDCVSCVLFCSLHAMTSCVIYYSTEARKNEIYLLNKMPLQCVVCDTDGPPASSKFWLQKYDCKTQGSIEPSFLR